MKQTKVSIGTKFHSLTVLDMRSIVRGKTSPRREIQLLCRCDFCGSEKWYPKANIVNGYTKSCGCSASKIKHGEWHTRLYGIWSGMKRRCYVTTCKMYKYYGGRGIKVCDEWKDYIPFRDWALSHGYTEKLTIDRIDVNGDYCPENCRWSTYLVQQNNRRNNHIIEYQGKEYTVSELARKHDVSPTLVSGRLRKGWSIEEALSKEDFRGKYLNGARKLYKGQGKENTLEGWATELGITKRKLSHKLYYYGTIDEVICRIEFEKYRKEYKETHNTKWAPHTWETWKK